MSLQKSSGSQEATLLVGVVERCLAAAQHTLCAGAQAGKRACGGQAHLEDSARGPTGDLDSSRGELPICTSWSRFRDSFLSSPASLPAPNPRACGQPRPHAQKKKCFLAVALDNHDFKPLQARPRGVVNRQCDILARGNIQEYASMSPCTMYSPTSTLSRKALSLR